MVTINLKKITALTSKEHTFIYSMMVKYGGMPMHVEEEYQPPPKPTKQNRNFKQKRKPVKQKIGKSFPIDKTKPNLYDFNDPLWDKCTDQNFLIFRVIMERVA